MYDEITNELQDNLIENDEMVKKLVDSVYEGTISIHLEK